MINRIKMTEEFLEQKFDESIYFRTHEEEKRYRLEHSYRVANIGKWIANNEGFDEEALIIACLLHDVSYCMEFKSKEDHLNHGRYSANIARPFLKSIGLEEKSIEEICYGIAIHVDDCAECEGQRTPFAISVGDADNIDRFDVYRIFDNLQYLKFDQMTLEAKREKVTSTLEKLNKYKSLELATKTATELWQDNIEFQIQFFNRLMKQLGCSDEVSDSL